MVGPGGGTDHPSDTSLMQHVLYFRRVVFPKNAVCVCLLVVLGYDKICSIVSV